MAKLLIFVMVAGLAASVLFFIDGHAGRGAFGLLLPAVAGVAYLQLRAGRD